MPIQPNSERLRLLRPSSDPTHRGIGKEVTLSGLLDQVSLDQALEMLKIYYLQSLGEELKGIRTRLTTLTEHTDRIARQ